MNHSMARCMAKNLDGLRCVVIGGPYCLQKTSGFVGAILTNLMSIMLHDNIEIFMLYLASKFIKG